MSERAVAWLRELGAQDVAHPGGTLLLHLERVRGLLASWGARPALQRAGLCHAFYGTDGFPTALLPLARRAELAEVIGEEAESLVYLYAAATGLRRIRRSTVRRRSSGTGSRAGSTPPRSGRGGIWPS